MVEDGLRKYAQSGVREPSSDARIGIRWCGEQGGDLATGVSAPHYLIAITRSTNWSTAIPVPS